MLSCKTDYSNKKYGITLLRSVTFQAGFLILKGGNKSQCVILYADAKK